MVSPAQQLPSLSPQAPSMPQLLQPSVHPQAFYTQDSENLCQLPRQEQPFPTAWAPVAGVARPVTPGDLQMAPSCLFDPQVSSVQWMNTSMPPPATSTFSYSTQTLPIAVLRCPQGCETPMVWAAPGTPHQSQRQHLQGRASTPTSLVLPTGFAKYQDTERQFQQFGTSNMPIPMVMPPSSVHSHCAGLTTQAVGDSSSTLPQSKVLLLDSQDSASHVPMPGDPGSCSRATSHPDIGSLSLPMELLTPDYSTPETTNAVLSLEHLHIIGKGPEELWWELGTDLPDF